MSRRVTVTLAIVAVIFVLFANFSLWLANSIFNRRAFVETTVNVVQSERVREAVAAEIVDTALADRPILREVAGEPAQSLVSSLLGAEVMRPVIALGATQLHELLTAEKPQSVTIDLSGAERFLEPLQGTLEGSFGINVPTTQIPDRIVLIEEGQVPSISGWGQVVVWVGPFLGLIGLGIAAAMIWWSGGPDRRSVIRTLGGTLAIGGVVFLLVTRIVKIPLLSGITDENARLIADNVYDGFIGRLTWQTLLLVAIGVTPFVVDYVRTRRAKPEAELPREKKAA